MGLTKLKNELNKLDEQCEKRQASGVIKYCKECPVLIDCNALCGLDEPEIFLQFLNSADTLNLI